MKVVANEKAEAEKILQIKHAKGDWAWKACQHHTIEVGLRDTLLASSVNVPGTTSKDIMDMVLVTQYLDTMKEVGALSSHGPGAVKYIASQIRDGLIQANTT